MNTFENESSLHNKFRLTGGLFLLAFVFYREGTALVSNGQKTFGLIVMLVNSAVVTVIGTFHDFPT